MFRRRVPYIPNHEAYKTHYGSGIPGVFRGDIYQDGYGIGGIISSFMRNIVPILTGPIGQKVGKTLLRSGVNIVKDIVKGKKPKTSLKQHGLEGVKSLVKDLFSPNPPTAQPSKKRRKLNPTTPGRVKKSSTGKQTKLRRRRVRKQHSKPQSRPKAVRRDIFS